jgi:hypothetical protein
MRFPRAWLGLEVRRRWRSLLVLALLVACAAATVMAAVAGARRGVSAFERLRAGTLPADAQVLNQDPAFDWDRVRALPGVAAVSSLAISALNVEGAHLGWDSTPPADSEIWRAVERPVVLAGRLPDPARADEVAVLPRFLDRYGKRVGDSVVIRLSTPQEVDLLSDSALDSSARPGGHGPRIVARIVGVIRSPWFADPIGGEGVVIPSPGLFLTYRDNFLGAAHHGFTVALVRLRDGESGLAAFRSRLVAVAGRPDIQVDNLAAGRRHVDQLLSYEASVLLALGLAALAATALLIGQFVARQVGSSLAELQTLRGVGLAPRQAVTAAAIGPLVAGTLGTGLGVLGAALASRWTPIGAAANYEPHPGFDLDWAVLAVGLVAVPAAVAAGATAYAWITLAATRSARRPARSAVASAAGRMGWPVPILTGLRFTLERGRGRTALPVRSALTGTVAGVAGVLAALTFSAGVSDAAANPARYGQTHQLMIILGVNGHGVPAKQLLPALTGDPDVAGVEDRKMSAAVSGDTTFSLYGYAPVGRPLPAGLMAGRLPGSGREIMLAVGTARTLAAEIGESVRVTGPRGSRHFTVSGIGFVPEGPANSYAEGALTTSSGYDSLFGSFDIDTGFIALRPGADDAAVIARLHRKTDAVKGAGPVGFLPFYPPKQLAEVQDIRVLPIALGGLLAVLALAAAGHTLAAAGRRRRHEVAVLRAMGMTRRQARWIAVTQAGTLAVIGLALGIPLGLVVGRVLWRVVADDTPLLYVPPTPASALLLIGPVAVLAAGLLAAWPARAAARLRVADVLRAE